MRIGCLQFAPQVGDVSNNLSRADAVLAKANQRELEDLDLLVLPEMAFSGKQLLLSHLPWHPFNVGTNTVKRIQLQVPGRNPALPRTIRIWNQCIVGTDKCSQVRLHCRRRLSRKGRVFGLTTWILSRVLQLTACCQWGR